MSSSHETFKGQSTHTRVRTVTNVCIDGLPSNLVQMSSLKHGEVTLTRILTSKLFLLRNIIPTFIFVEKTLVINTLTNHFFNLLI